MLLAASVATRGARALADGTLGRAACVGDSVGIALDLGLPARSTLAALAATRDGESVLVVTRVVAPDRTRVSLEEVSSRGERRDVPRELFSVGGRRAGSVGVAVRDGVRLVWWTGSHGLRIARFASGWPAPRTDALGPPPGADGGAPLVVPSPHGALILWRSHGAMLVQSVAAADDAVSPPQRVALPGNSALVAAAASGPREPARTALVLRSPGRRFYVARLQPSPWRALWTGVAPAGCEHGRCPEVGLLGAPDGFVASWYERRARDGLRVLALRALDREGRPRQAPVVAIPLARPVAAAATTGAPVILQLARPVLVRGGAQPVVLPAPAFGPDQYPTMAASWITEGSEPRLEVIAGTRSGELRLGALRCSPGAQGAP